MAQRPLALSLLLCEQVIVDARSKRVTPVNCFSKWDIKGAVTEPQAFWVFAILTDGQGSMPAAIEIECLEHDNWSLRRDFTLRFEGPLQRLRFMIEWRRVRFPMAGAFQVTLLVAGEGIASARFSVLGEE